MMIDDSRDGMPQHPIDVITVEINEQILATSPQQYKGKYGIATMTLGFSLSNTCDQFIATHNQTSKYAVYHSLLFVRYYIS